MCSLPPHPHHTAQTLLHILIVLLYYCRYTTFSYSFIFYLFCAGIYCIYRVQRVKYVYVHIVDLLLGCVHIFIVLILSTISLIQQFLHEQEELKEIQVLVLIDSRDRNCSLVEVRHKQKYTHNKLHAVTKCAYQL